MKIYIFQDYSYTKIYQRSFNKIEVQKVFRLFRKNKADTKTLSSKILFNGKKCYKTTGILYKEVSS